MTASQPAQRRIHRSFTFVRMPLVIEAVLVTCLTYEVAKQNFPAPWREHWWGSVDLMGIAPTSALVGAVAVVLFARSQYALVTSPAIAGHSGGWTAVGEAAELWSMSIHNAGAGLARIDDVRYRIAIDTDRPVSRSAASATKYLDQACPVLEVGRFLRDVSAGAPLKAATDSDKAIPFVTLDETTARRIQHLEVIIQFTDPLGDQYTWTKNVKPIIPPFPKDGKRKSGHA